MKEALTTLMGVDTLLAGKVVTMTTQRREQVVPIVLQLLGVETRFLLEMMWRIIRHSIETS